MNESGNFQEQIEIIDNENINEALCDLETQCEKNIALAELIAIQWELNEQLWEESYDIDLAYDSVNKKYYFIAEEKWFSSKISMWVDEIKFYWDILIKYLTAEWHSLTNNVLQLWGKPDRRYVTANDSWGWSAWDKTLYTRVLENEWNAVAENNLTEELYKFAVNLRGEELIINWVCPSDQTEEECKNQLGIAENDITKAIDLEISRRNDYTDYAIKLNPEESVYDLIDEQISIIWLAPEIQASIRSYMEANKMSFWTVDVNTLLSLKTYSDKIVIEWHNEPITINIKNIFKKTIGGHTFQAEVD